MSAGFVTQELDDEIIPRHSGSVVNPLAPYVGHKILVDIDGGRTGIECSVLATDGPNVTLKDATDPHLLPITLNLSQFRSYPVEPKTIHLAKS